MAEFASKGVAGTGLGLGIAGTALGLLNGGLGNILGNAGCSENNLVNRYELEMENKIVAKDSEIALLKSNIYTDQKIADVYERLITRVNADQRAQADWNASQSVANAQMTAAIAANQTSIAGLANTLGSLTKTVIPNNNVCPGWGSVQVEPVSLNACNGCGCTGTSSLY